MSFIISAGNNLSLESAIVQESLEAHSKDGCGVEGCTATANWKTMKSDGAYDKHMRAHRVKGGKMEAKSPPGWKHKIEHMKESHPEIDNPFALAWYQHDKGSNGKDVKAEGNVREQMRNMLEQRHESSVRAKSKKVEAEEEGNPDTGFSADKKVGDIQAPKKIKAGGPGSGRKPEFGNKNKSRLESFHKTLSKNGYSYTGLSKSKQEDGHAAMRHQYRHADGGTANITEIPSTGKHYLK